MLLFMQNLQGTASPITTGVVPNLVGLAYGAAQQAASDLGFDITSSGTFFDNPGLGYTAPVAYSDTVPEDYVATQDPAAGEVVDLGALIEIVRSGGPDPRNHGEVSRMRFTPYYSSMRFKVQ